MGQGETGLYDTTALPDFLVANGARLDDIGIRRRGWDSKDALP